MCSFADKIWQPSGEGRFYESVPTYIYICVSYHVSQRPGMLIMVKIWQLSSQVWYLSWYRQFFMAADEILICIPGL